MRIPASDILYVSLQFLLFFFYFLSPFKASFEPPYLAASIAMLLAIAGLAILLISVAQLNKNLSPFPTPKPTGSLQQTGIYSKVRHPVYSGILLAAAGFAVFEGSVWKICITAALYVLFHFKSGYEEKQLQRKFPGYADYKKKTGRFFPRLN